MKISRRLALAVGASLPFPFALKAEAQEPNWKYNLSLWSGPGQRWMDCGRFNVDGKTAHIIDPQFATPCGYTLRANSKQIEFCQTPNVSKFIESKQLSFACGSGHMIFADEVDKTRSKITTVTHCDWRQLKIGQLYELHVIHLKMVNDPFTIEFTLECPQIERLAPGNFKLIAESVTCREIKTTIA